MSFWSDNPAATGAVVGALVGLISGVGSTILKGLFDEHVQTKRLRFEQDNARQQKLINAQSALLDELARVCWKWRYDAMQVVYYGRESEQKACQRAIKGYSDNIWTNLSQIRFMGTQAGRLFSRSALDKIEEFYGHVDSIDLSIEQAIQVKDAAKRKTLFKKIYPIVQNDIRTEIADLILNLAEGVDFVPRK